MKNQGQKQEKQKPRPLASSPKRSSKMNRTRLRRGLWDHGCQSLHFFVAPSRVHNRWVHTITIDYSAYELPDFTKVQLFNRFRTSVPEKIVMTPKKPKAVNSTRLKIERKSFPVTPSSGVGGIKNGTPTLASQNGSSSDTPKAKKVHVAGGSYAGIVINKQQDEDDASKL